MCLNGSNSFRALRLRLRLFLLRLLRRLRRSFRLFLLLRLRPRLPPICDTSLRFDLSIQATTKINKSINRNAIAIYYNVNIQVFSYRLTL